MLYISLNGDKCESKDLKEFFGEEYSKAEEHFTNNIPLITGLDVYTSKENQAIVTFGDSITAGMWPDFFAQRLNRLEIKHLSVLRQGIGGNRILHDSSQQFDGLYGIAGIKRFEDDAIKQSGVKYIIILEGINDIMHLGSAAPISETVST